MILAGGLGTRLSEETDRKPKPMVEIGNRPILWHVMQHYARYGHREFVLCVGYRGDLVKRYFVDYRNLAGDLTVHTASGEIEATVDAVDDWIVQLVETGLNTNTGGRVRRAAAKVSDGTFLLTYCDGVATVDLDALVDFHRAHGRLATITAVRPPARFGGLELDGDRVAVFSEKPQVGEGWINGGFMVFEPAAAALIAGDESSLEADLLEELAKMGELMAYRHTGFWQSMDTLRDMRLLQHLWDSGSPPWLTTR
jgi:glucose-1-phosphate cytidylyltransferase